MLLFVSLLACFLRAVFASRRSLALENLALRQQLATYARLQRLPRLKPQERAFWVALSRVWQSWRSPLVFVKPATVIDWHRAGFRRYWTWRSRPKGGRPAIDPEVRKLIRRMATANMWGAPRIHGELLKLGIKISQATVSKYLPLDARPGNRHTWSAGSGPCVASCWITSS